MAAAELSSPSTDGGRRLPAAVSKNPLTTPVGVGWGSVLDCTGSSSSEVGSEQNRTAHQTSLCSELFPNGFCSNRSPEHILRLSHIQNVVDYLRRFGLRNVRGLVAQYGIAVVDYVAAETCFELDRAEQAGVSLWEGVRSVPALLHWRIRTTAEDWGLTPQKKGRRDGTG